MSTLVITWPKDHIRSKSEVQQRFVTSVSSKRNKGIVIDVKPDPYWRPSALNMSIRYPHSPVRSFRTIDPHGIKDIKSLFMACVLPEIANNPYIRVNYMTDAVRREVDERAPNTNLGRLIWTHLLIQHLCELIEVPYFFDDIIHHYSITCESEYRYSTCNDNMRKFHRIIKNQNLSVSGNLT